MTSLISDYKGESDVILGFLSISGDDFLRTLEGIERNQPFSKTLPQLRIP